MNRFDKIISMKYFAAILTCLCFISSSSHAKQLNIDSVSENPILAYLNKQATVNYIAFVGGEGVKGKASKSKNPVARSGKEFRDVGSNYFIFPNPAKKMKLSNADRNGGKDHMQRILNLINYIKTQNSLPIVLLGHSRGSISVSSAAKILGKENVKGIVVLSSITSSYGDYTPYYLTMESMLKKVELPVLVVHHEKDACTVSQYNAAKKLAEKNNYKLITISGGGTTGSVCGPLHYHGFEGTAEEVIRAVQEWSTTLQ